MRRANVFTLEAPPTAESLGPTSSATSPLAKQGSVIPTIRRRTSTSSVAESVHSDKAPSQSGTQHALEGWDWRLLPEADRKRISHMQAKEHKKFLSQSQRQLHQQREMIANLRTQNAALRTQYQDKISEHSSLLEDKTTSQVNALLLVKFGIEEDIEKDLENMEALKKQIRAKSQEIQKIIREAKSASSDRELEREIRKKEEQIHHYATLHGEEVTKGKQLRSVINELRHDKLNVKKKMDEKKVQLEDRTLEVIQLINIANDFYADRAYFRVLQSEKIADAGREAEDHRSVIQELNNRVEYYDLMMKEREDDYQKALQEAERQASNMNDPQEEVKEAERKRQQELIEAFDKLMHSFGVWDVGELVERFLAKEDKFAVQSRYLEALKNDADKMQDKITSLQKEAELMKEHQPHDDIEVKKIQAAAKAAEEKADHFHEMSTTALERLDDITDILAELREKMDQNWLLKATSQARRRWGLIRKNLKRIRLMSEKPLGDGTRIQAVLPRVTNQKFDPRRKTLREEIGDSDAATQGLEAILELGRIEDQALVLLAHQAAKKRMKRTRSRGRGPNTAAGPKFGPQKSQGRAEALVIPSLKDIDSPRDTDALSAREIHKTVQESGYSERVAEKVKRAVQARQSSILPRHSMVGRDSLSASRKGSITEGERKTSLGPSPMDQSATATRRRERSILPGATIAEGLPGL